MKHTKKTLLVPLKLGVAALLIAGSSNASAVLIAEVDFMGDGPFNFNRTPENLSNDSGITVSSGGFYDGWSVQTAGSSSGGSNPLDFPSSNDFLRDSEGIAAGSTSGDNHARMRGGKIFSFSITIDSSTTISLDRIVFDARGAIDGETTTRGLAFRTSLDAEDLWSNPTLVGRTADPNWENVVVDLSGSTYQNLTDTSISFRWFTDGAVDIDTIQVYAIPEPTTALLGGLGLLALLRRRR